MQTHQATLAHKPFAAFLVCMTLAMPGADKYREHVATWLEPVRALVRPVGEGLFAGVLDISGNAVEVRREIHVLSGTEIDPLAESVVGKPGSR